LRSVIFILLTAPESEPESELEAKALFEWVSNETKGKHIPHLPYHIHFVGEKNQRAGAATKE